MCDLCKKSGKIGKKQEKTPRGTHPGLFAFFVPFLPIFINTFFRVMPSVPLKRTFHENGKGDILQIPQNIPTEKYIY